MDVSHIYSLEIFVQRLVLLDEIFDFSLAIDVVLGHLKKGD